MNVYDFDKTIFDGDSATHFWNYCIYRYPAAIRVLPALVHTAVTHIRDPEIHGVLKEKMFSVLRFVPDIDKEVRVFWDENMDRVFSWYLQRKREDDLVISASPSFLIGEVCGRLGVRYIATEMDTHTGRLLSPNCRGQEKVKRFQSVYGDAVIDEFFSDSYADRPMMELARSAFLLKKGSIVSRIR